MTDTREFQIFVEDFLTLVSLYQKCSWNIDSDEAMMQWSVFVHAPPTLYNDLHILLRLPPLHLLS